MGRSIELELIDPPVSRKLCRDNRWIIFYLLNSAYYIRVPDGPPAQDYKRHPSIVVSIYIYNICIYMYVKNFKGKIRSNSEVV